MEIYNDSPFHPAPLVGRLPFPGYSLTLIVKGTFDLSHGNSAVLSEEQIYPSGDEFQPGDEEETGSPRYEMDFAYVKPRADLLLVGKCHSPRGVAVTSSRVRFKVGERERILLVHGDRVWEGGLFHSRPSEPQPFTEMPLIYENSFGGSGYKANPVGRGYGKTRNASGKSVRTLPNLEDPSTPVSSPRNRPDPAGFGPLGRSWSARVSRMGTYGKSYLRNRWPWFPEDFDWSYFNAAPPQQQLDGYLVGDEKLIFENVHPEHVVYESRLPGLRARCFLNRLVSPGAADTRFDEVAMNLDTLWVDMESEKLVLLWRGWTTVLSEEYDELLHLFVTCETLEGSSKSHDECRNRLSECIREEEEAFEPVLEEPEEGEPDEVGDEVEDDEGETIVDNGLKALSESLAKAGIVLGATPPLSAAAKEEQQRLLKDIGSVEGDAEDEEEQAGEFEAQGETLTQEEFGKRLAAGESFSGADLTGLNLSGLSLGGLDLSEAKLTGVSLKGATLEDSNLTSANLTGADLFGADARRAVFQGADLTRAQLASAHLDEADLTDAILTGADLREASMVDAILERAALSQALLDRVVARDAFFSEADFTGASLKHGSFESADFSKCALTRASFRGANLTEASVEGASAVEIDMSEADITGLRASEEGDFSRGNFRHVIGPETIWNDSNLTEADFSFSNLDGALFSSSSLERACLHASSMKGARLARANLKQADLRQVNLFEGSLERADLTGSDWSGANMYGVEFLNAIVEGVRGQDVNLKMTKLKKIGDRP